MGTSNFRMMLIARPTMLKIDRYGERRSCDTYQQATWAIRLLADQARRARGRGVDNRRTCGRCTLGIEYARGFFLGRAPPRTRRPPCNSPRRRRRSRSGRLARTSLVAQAG
jgi:hypothetical protein